jgi:hypothetical protein
LAEVFAQMDKITVAELATECSVKNQVVLAELKRLGLYVFSPTATIDASFAETIRKKILSQREAEEAKAVEVERKKEAEAARKTEKPLRSNQRKYLPRHLWLHGRDENTTIESLRDL